MCLVISLIFMALAYVFLQDGNMQGVYINFGISVLFLALMIRNILKVKKDRS